MSEITDEQMDAFTASLSSADVLEYLEAAISEQDETVQGVIADEYERILRDEAQGWLDLEGEEDDHTSEVRDAARP